MLPQSLDRIEFWTVRRLEQQDDVLWYHQILALVKASVIDLEKVETVGKLLGKLIEKSLIAVGIHMRKLQEKGISGRRFHRTIDPEGFE